VDAVAPAIEPLSGNARDYDSLLELVGSARFVLLGEASHGTREFYAERAAITRRLIVEKAFSAVCIEGDWPDAYRVDRYVRNASDDTNADDALAGFVRFPAWMWRNDVVRDFVAWLSDYNDDHLDARVGFYGLDLARRRPYGSSSSCRRRRWELPLARVRPPTTSFRPSRMRDS
jgi:erythromycin esterase-like protein